MSKLSFAAWMGAVDQAVSDKVGLSVYDLEDQPFADWYDDGVSPTAAAKRAVKFSSGGLL